MQFKVYMCPIHDHSWVKDWLDVYPTIENEDLKQTMGWDNKGKMHGANYNWYKDNPKVLGSLYEQIPTCTPVFCRWRVNYH